MAKSLLSLEFIFAASAPLPSCQRRFVARPVHAPKIAADPLHREKAEIFLVTLLKFY